MDPHVLYFNSLSLQDKQLLALREFLYEGNWEEMIEDLEIRKNSKPFLVKMQGFISGEVESIERLRSYEQSHDVNLGIYTLEPEAFVYKHDQPVILLQAQIVTYKDSTEAHSQLVESVGLPWLAIVKEIEKDPNFLFQFTKFSRKFEEFIAATYKRDGWPEVYLTPQRGDAGVDVIAIKPGLGSVRFLDQAKAYSPHHLVTADQVRGMLGALAADSKASKGIITTTSRFASGIERDPQIKAFVPTRLELRDGDTLLRWFSSVRRKHS